MNKRFLGLLLTACLILSGCQLAREEGLTEPIHAAQQVIGVLVSVETPGEEEPGAIHSREMLRKKLYAELAEETYETADGGVGITHTYRFPEGTGLCMMAFYISGEISGAEPYWSSFTDEGIHVTTNTYHNVDGVSGVEMRGVIHPASTFDDMTIYLHPIYQSPDGRVYAVGTGDSAYAGPNADGAGLGFGIEWNAAVGEVSTGLGAGFAGISIRTVPTPGRYVLVQMDEKDQILSESEFAPEEMPESFTPAKDCAYVILEARSQEDTVARTVYSPGDGESIESYLLLENGLCARQSTAIDWEEAK